MSTSNVRTSSTLATTSSLRPRTRRLISGLDEGDEVDFDPATAPNIRIASSIPSLLEQRPVSPIPPTHLPRSTSSYDRRGTTTTSRDRGTGVRGLGPSDSTTSIERLWGTSWTAIQGIASDLLGSSSHEGPPLAKGKVPRSRRPQGQSQQHRPSTSAPATWGPKSVVAAPTITDVGAGTKEEAEAAFRARKRIDLLTREETSFVDSSGRYKRRTSDDGLGTAGVHEQNNARDALVYVHHVQKGDTLAGITLKFNCTAEVVRRTNRMWPNDPIQSRTVILLPVDACGVKGKPVGGPEEVDLLGDENAPMPPGLAETPSVASLAVDGEASSSRRNRSNSNITSTTGDRSSSVARSTTTTSEPAWHHDCWVLLPGSTKPTEIARLLRQNLGYFPPARRKSQTFSDVDSPKTSFDRPRSLVAEALNQASHSPSRRSVVQKSSRRVSNASNGYFPSSLTGPGGVGTMDRSVRGPGPGQDGLNLLFAKHLPDVAPPQNQHALYQPDNPFFSDELTPTPSGTTTPSTGRNIEHMGSAIETWMRRVASKAKGAATSTDRQRAARASVGAPGKGAGGIGDLIEMTDEFEIGMDDEPDDEPEYARGRPTAAVDSGPVVTSTAYAAASARQRGKSGKAD